MGIIRMCRLSEANGSILDQKLSMTSKDNEFYDTVTSIYQKNVVLAEIKENAILQRR